MTRALMLFELVVVAAGLGMAWRTGSAETFSWAVLAVYGALELGRDAGKAAAT